jgi:hypothetical protein
MTANVQRIVDQVKDLPEEERDELLTLLAEFELQQVDARDEQIAGDSQPGGRLEDDIQRDLKFYRNAALGQMAGLWKDRDDLPDFDALRKSWDRQFPALSEETKETPPG